MKRQELLSLLDKKSIAWAATGSRYICRPAPTDTDEDYIALMVKGMEKSLTLAGFVQNTNEERYDAMPDFWAFRLGEFNVIVTFDEGFYRRFCEATETAKARNLLQKSDRIALFQKVLYGVPVMDLDAAPRAAGTEQARNVNPQNIAQNAPLAHRHGD